MKAGVWDWISITVLKEREIWTLREKGTGYSPEGLRKHNDFRYARSFRICQ